MTEKKQIRLTAFSVLLMLVQLISGACLYAQETRTVTGTVKNSQDNIPLPAVSVYLKEKKSVATQTDSTGHFSLRVPVTGGTLVFSSVGLENKEMPITASANMAVILTPSPQALEQVVVVGYGVQKKSLVTGAIASVNQKDLEVPGLMRADQAIQGRVAGVTVMQNSGQPGSGVSIRIRGAGTNGTNDPLYIVDGYPVGDLEAINPRDIETMEVLKDASSAAIYGARGANGVIIVTTKKGKAGRTNVNYEYYYGFQNIRKKVDVLDATQYARIVNEAYFNSGQPLPFSEDEIQKLGKGTDWQREISYLNAPVQSHQLSVSSGTEKSTLNASFSYFNQDGTIAKGKSNFKRYTARVNGEQKYIDGLLLVGENVSVTQVYRSSVASNSGNAGPILSAINMDPVTSVLNDDGTFAISRYVAQEIVNPVARIYYTNGGSSYTRANGNAFGELTIIKGLKLKSTVSYTIQYDESHGYTPIYYLNATNLTTATGASKAMAVSNYFNLENTLTYNKSLQGHNFTGLIGNTVNTGNGSNVSGSKNGLLYDDPNYAYLDLAKDNTSAAASGGAWHSSLVSYFGRLNYDYKNKYMLTAIFRADGSFRFGPNNRFGYFPSVSAGWNVSREDFMRDVRWLRSLKMRASWGRTGNDNIGDYKYVSTISTYARNYYFGSNVQFVGASPSGVSNSDLKWETSEQSNIGIDAAILKNFTVTLDFYSKTTKDLLVTIPIPAYVGNGAPTGNAGNVNNKGVELTLGYHTDIGKVSVDASVNGAYNKNTVTYVGNASGFIVGASANNQMSGVTRMQAGYPIGYFWLYTQDGIFQTQSEVNNYKTKDGLIQPNAVPGDIRYKDLNGDGKIDNNDRSMVGSPHPKYNFGGSLTLRWKGFEFYAFAYGLAGNKIFNALRRWDLPTANYPVSIMNRWHGEGTSDTYPRVSTGDLNGNFSNPSTFFLEDGSFLRLKTVTLSYTFKDLRKIRVNNLRLYVTGNNLFVLTKYSGWDPEISGSALGLGIDNGIYPQPRTITFGASVGF
ncbi:MAG: TonB-dependent receptor [Filimonas sp.]|nr:TonB-dependent receptor [Filimonas sp.]